MNKELTAYMYKGKIQLYVQEISEELAVFYDLVWNSFCLELHPLFRMVPKYANSHREDSAATQKFLLYDTTGVDDYPYGEADVVHVTDIVEGEYEKYVFRFRESGNALCPSLKLGADRTFTIRVDEKVTQTFEERSPKKIGEPKTIMVSVPTNLTVKFEKYGQCVAITDYHGTCMNVKLWLNAEMKNFYSEYVTIDNSQESYILCLKYDDGTYLYSVYDEDGHKYFITIGDDQICIFDANDSGFSPIITLKDRARCKVDSHSCIEFDKTVKTHTKVSYK